MKLKVINPVQEARVKLWNAGANPIYPVVRLRVGAYTIDKDFQLEDISMRAYILYYVREIFYG